jgi:O-antigen/teichoic acid export membrane protein
MTATAPTEIRKAESVFKPALLLMSGRALAFLATFFIPVVLARIFDPGQFGTYKQLFLVYSTVFFTAQLGMASSLYYFLPSAPLEAGRYVANSLVVLAAAGVAGFAVLVIAAPQVGRSMSNGALTQYLPWIGLYLLLMMLSAALEIVLIARGKYLWASASYCLSDLTRAAAFILPVLLFRRLDWLLRGAVLVAALRTTVTALYFRSEFRGSFRLDLKLMRRQLAYALPLGMAVLVEILQGSVPPYLVSYLSTPATFAIFAVGCLSIPLVDFAASPSSDVMMVRMQESLAAGHKRAVVEIWHDTTWKLALLFFPLTALVIVSARELIVLLFTQKYEASVPLFMAWSFLILMATFQVDGALRVFAQTRVLLALNLVRLAIVGGLIAISLREFQLLGPVLVIVLATLTFKVLALARMTTLLEVTLAQLLPWRQLCALFGVSAAAAGAALLVRSQIHESRIVILMAMSATHILIYCLLVWQLKLLNETERSAIGSWIDKTFNSRSRVAYGD